MNTPNDLASVDRVLSTARSVRRKLDFDRPLDPAVVHECIDIATQAPTGAAGESWRFLIVTEEGKKRVLSRLYTDVLDQFTAQRGLQIKPTQKALVARLHEIPAMVFVCANAPHPGPEIAAQVAYYGSVLPAAWSLMLAFRARHIASTWTTLRSARQREVAAVLDIPDHVVQTVMLPAGYMKDARLHRAERAAAHTVTFWNGWDSRDGP